MCNYILDEQQNCNRTFSMNDLTNVQGYLRTSSTLLLILSSTLLQVVFIDKNDATFLIGNNSLTEICSDKEVKPSVKLSFDYIKCRIQLLLLTLNNLKL